MADNDPDLTIGVTLDTFNLPQQAAEAENKVKEALDRTTASVTALGNAAKKSGAAHQQAAAGSTQGLEKMNKAAKAGSSTLTSGFGGATAALGKVTAAIDGVSAALGVVGKVFGIVAVVSAVISAVRGLTEWLGKMREAARGAGARLREIWALADRAEALKRAQEAPLKSLNDQIAAHEKLLGLLQKEAELESSRREFAAAAARNEDVAEQERLNRALILGKITQEQHLAATRRLEDRGRQREQQAELAAALRAEEIAEKDRQGKEDALKNATRNLSDLEATGRRYGMVEGDVSGLRRTLLQWEEANRLVRQANASVVPDIVARQPRRDRAEAEKIILAAADALSIDVQDSEDNAKTMEDLVAAITQSWPNRLKAAQESTQARGAEYRQAAEAEELARVKREGVWDMQQSANALVAEKRRTEDARLENDARERYEKTAAEAAEARAAAEKAAAEAAQARERDAAKRRLTARKEKATALREDYKTGLAAQKDMAAPSQQAGIKALESLLQRAQKDPAVMRQLAALVSGEGVSLSRSQARAYGQDITALKSAPWNREQVQGIRSLVSLLNRTLQAERRVTHSESAARHIQKLDQEEGLKTSHTEAERQAARAAELTAKTEQQAGKSLRVISQSMHRMANSSSATLEVLQQTAADFSRLEARLSTLESQLKNSKR